MSRMRVGLTGAGFIGDLRGAAFAVDLHEDELTIAEGTEPKIPDQV